MMQKMQVVDQKKSRNPSTDSESSLGRLYVDVFPLVARIVHRHGGTLGEAQDIFHDAIVIFIEQNNAADDKILRSQEAYIVGIVKHLCYRHFKKKVFTDDLSLHYEKVNIPADYFPAINDRKLLRFVEKAGQKCLHLLHDFYYTMLPVKEIAERFGYANEHSVSVQKYKCLEKLKKIVKFKSLQYEDFVE